VVGSIRVDDPDMVRYRADLADLCGAVPGATLHSGYVSDELFDRWIVAADTVVLPYRNIWSSGVLERAGLFGVPVIATRVGGLSEQAATQLDVRLVEDDDELRRAMLERLPEQAVVPETAWAAVGTSADLRAAVQEQVRSRASARPTGRAAGRRSAAVLDPVAALSSAPLRRLGRLGPPDTNHRRRSVRFVKRLLRRATAWQVDPLLHQLNELQSATVLALESARPAGGQLPASPATPGSSGAEDPAAR